MKKSANAKTEKIMSLYLFPGGLVGTLSAGTAGKSILVHIGVLDTYVAGQHFMGVGSVTDTINPASSSSRM